MSSEIKKILTTDGIPLEVSLKKAEKKNKIKAFLLVAPLLFFIIITYVFPIGDMLMRSVDDKMVTEMLPKTFKSMEKWDGKELPPEEVFEAFYLDFQVYTPNMALCRAYIAYECVKEDTNFRFWGNRILLLTVAEKCFATKKNNIQCNFFTYICIAIFPNFKCYFIRFTDFTKYKKEKI